SALREISVRNAPGKDGSDILLAGVAEDDDREFVVWKPLEAGGETGGRTAVANVLSSFVIIDSPAKAVRGELAIGELEGSPKLLELEAVEQFVGVEGGVPFR